MFQVRAFESGKARSLEVSLSMRICRGGALNLSLRSDYGDTIYDSSLRALAVNFMSLSVFNLNFQQPEVFNKIWFNFFLSLVPQEIRLEAQTER